MSIQTGCESACIYMCVELSGTAFNCPSILELDRPTPCSYCESAKLIMDPLSDLFPGIRSFTTASSLTSVPLYSSTMSQSSTAITPHISFSAANSRSLWRISLPASGDPGTPQSSDNTQRTAVPTQTVYSSISASTTAQHLSTR